MALEVIGFLMVTVCIICLILKAMNILPQSDWYFVGIGSGFALHVMGSAIEPITEKTIQNAGIMSVLINPLVCALFVPLIWINHVDHPTTAMVAVFSIGCIIAAIGFIMASLKWRKLKKLQNQHLENKN